MDRSRHLNGVEAPDQVNGSVTIGLLRPRGRNEGLFTLPHQWRSISAGEFTEQIELSISPFRPRSLTAAERGRDCPLLAGHRVLVAQ